jgi:hypothetical protein
MSGRCKAGRPPSDPNTSLLIGPLRPASAPPSPAGAAASLPPATHASRRVRAPTAARAADASAPSEHPNRFRQTTAAYPRLGAA